MLLQTKTASATNASGFLKLSHFWTGDGGTIPRLYRCSQVKSPSISLAKTHCAACGHKPCVILVRVRQLVGSNTVMVAVCRCCWKKLTGQLTEGGSNND